MDPIQFEEFPQDNSIIDVFKKHPLLYPTIESALFVVGILWLELFLALLSDFNLDAYRAGAVLLCSLGLAFSLQFLQKLLGNFRCLSILILEILTCFYAMEYFVNSTYYIFMSPSAVLAGSKGVMNEFSDAVYDVIRHGLPTILWMHLPVMTLLFFVLSSRKLRSDPTEKSLKKRLPSILASLIAGVFFFSMASGAYENYNDATLTYSYTFDSATRKFGVMTACYLDSKYQLRGVPPAPIEETTQTETVDDTDLFNILNVDYAALAAATDNSEFSEMLRYVSYQPASQKNDYTGLFAGKNIIFITAESFSKELIDEELTPTLYRMATKGIRIQDYYQPFWGGSTTTGEASLLLGLIPCDGVPTMEETVGKDNRYTLANMLGKEGYFTAAYHAGSYDFYNRHITHPSLGYSYFLAEGNGLEGHVKHTWPGDDMGIEEYIADLYMDESPFHAYWMTYAGHGLYNFTGNQMSVRHHDEVKDLDKPEIIKAYIACNLDFEHALENMLLHLEEHGQLENTVIVVSSDHYPYALQQGDAWKNAEDFLSKLYGYYYSNQAERDHNALLIWTPSLEEEEPIVVKAPCYSVDVLPTLLNLFGLEYDSRLYVGRDILSDETPLVIWADGSWMTEAGYYNAASNAFIQKNEDVITQDYIESISRQVANKIRFSRYILRNDFYKDLQALQETMEMNSETSQ